MSRRKKEACCGIPLEAGNTCCRVESLIGVDDRGQMVLPKEIREKARIRPGDKLALVSWEREGEICCLFLIKADDLAELAQQRLGPIMKDMAG